MVYNNNNNNNMMKANPKRGRSSEIHTKVKGGIGNPSMKVKKRHYTYNLEH